MAPINAELLRRAELVQSGLQNIENMGAVRGELAGNEK